MAQRIAALTGATGFLGARLALALENRGWAVRALVRRPADEAALRRQGLATVPGDLADGAALAALSRGADAVVHCAGLIKARDRASFMAVNRDGAARLAAAASGRMVLISSLAARQPGLSDYAASKRAGEDAVRAALGERAVVVRPPVIYGPGDRETLALFRLVGGWPVAPIPADPAARLALAHADDVAEAVAEVLDRPRISGVFALGGARPDGYGWGEILRAAAGAMNRRPALAPIPGWAVMAAAAVSERLGAAGGATPIFTRGKAREMLHADWAVRPDELIPGAPAARFDLESGFADAVKWYRAAGWLQDLRCSRRG
jgi:nucleoside-diphosphate-sugar epimerase